MTTPRVRLVTSAAMTWGLWLVLAAPSGASAQSTQPASRRAYVALNPLGIPFEYFSAEFEAKGNSLLSLGATATYFGYGSAPASTFSVEGKLRLYPNEEWPRGFSIGVTAGTIRLNDRFFDGSRDVEEAVTRPTAGVEADYNWLLGRQKTVLVGAGLGAKRVLGETRDYFDVLTAYPTFRFVVGVLF